MNAIAKPLSRTMIREYANYIRESVGYDQMMFCPIAQLIEALEHEDSGFTLEIVGDEEMSDFYGLTSTADGVMKIRESVYDGAVEGNPRDRFTLAHELGHYLMHSPERISLARSIEYPKYCDPEWQANVFAAELLVPYRMIDNMEVGDIVEQCNVSWQCASIQKSYIK